MKKQLDPRIAILINNAVQNNTRAFIVLVGDRAKDQVVNLHFLLSQARVSARPSVLWCYKKELGFTTHRKKREAKIKRDVKRGARQPNDLDPFEIFVTVTDIRYTYYKESHKILGNTFGMCVLQDFEAITPNLLARTIETVQGGGLIVLMLKTMTSLKQLYTMSMDVHSRYRTSAHESIVARFNERFILSLSSCEDCLFLDDELNVLPVSKGKDIVPVPEHAPGDAPSVALKELQHSHIDAKPLGDLLKLAKTVDQAKALVTFVDAIVEKTLSSTVTLTSARGRGKSASLGLAVAAALAHGYSNIFITSPTPENLNTTFEFLFKGLDALGYAEHVDYDIAQSTNPDFNKAIVRVNVFRQHRQTIQYIQPEDAHFLGQAELVIIDEAAAIPLPVVRNLIGPYLVFLASTIHGYEGTGRSLSLKLIQQLRESTQTSAKSQQPTLDGDKATETDKKHKRPSAMTTLRSRALREIKLETPIRYNAGDNVEKWLNALLCLDATVGVHSSSQGCPHPSTCELYYVSRDTLFSYHPASELFLQRMMALYVASHYKNQPNDLQLMSDGPAHHLFVLLPPVKEDQASLPEPLVVLQVALEGNISKEIIMQSLGRGIRAGGDMIPWLISQQFQENRFGLLSGARIVRVATHPEFIGMGYGKRALELLNSFYSGEFFNFNHESDKSTNSTRDKHVSAPSFDQDDDLHNETVAIRAVNTMPPLLQRLSERKPETLDYLGVSYGVTAPLLRFWKRAGYVPLYVRQTTNDLTGEHTCVMVRGLNNAKTSELDWLSEFARDFRRRFLSLLSFQFSSFGSVTSLSMLEAVDRTVSHDEKELGPRDRELQATELSLYLTAFDVKRLEAYANNQLDYHVILDVLPVIASLYFEGRFGVEVKLSAVQRAILLAMGLQRKNVDMIESELQIPVSQILALFVKLLRKVTARLIDIQKSSLQEEEPTILRRQPAILQDDESVPNHPDLEANIAHSDELNETNARQKQFVDSLNLDRYAVDSTGDWSTAEAQVNAAIGRPEKSSLVSVKMESVAKRKRSEENGTSQSGGGTSKKKKAKRKERSE